MPQPALAWTARGELSTGPQFFAYDARLMSTRMSSSLQRSGRVHSEAFSFCRQGRGGGRGIVMSEQIKSPIISRRKVFWLAAIAAAFTAPATMLLTSNARAQQSDQAPAAEPTAPKTGQKKKKKRKTLRRGPRPLRRPVRRKRHRHHQNSISIPARCNVKPQPEETGAKSSAVVALRCIFRLNAQPESTGRAQPMRKLLRR